MHVVFVCFVVTYICRHILFLQLYCVRVFVSVFSYIMYVCFLVVLYICSIPLVRKNGFG